MGMVKNAVQNAAQNARKLHGVESCNLIVDQAVVNKASYVKGLDMKSKSRVGIKKKYRSHLLVTVREASEVELQRTKFHGRWRSARKVLELPWEERVRHLPRYRPFPGYSPV